MLIHLIVSLIGAPVWYLNWKLWPRLISIKWLLRSMKPHQDPTLNVELLEHNPVFVLVNELCFSHSLIFFFNRFSFDELVCKFEASEGWNSLTRCSHIYDDGNKLCLNIKHRRDFPTSSLEDKGLVAECTLSDRWFIDV